MPSRWCRWRPRTVLSLSVPSTRSPRRATMDFGTWVAIGLFRFATTSTRLPVTTMPGEKLGRVARDLHRTLLALQLRQDTLLLRRREAPQRQLLARVDGVDRVQVLDLVGARDRVGHCRRARDGDLLEVAGDLRCRTSRPGSLLGRGVDRHALRPASPDAPGRSSRTRPSARQPQPRARRRSRCFVCDSRSSFHTLRCLAG